MSTATANRRPLNQQPRQSSDAETLDLILEESIAQFCKPVQTLLEQQLKRIEELLPAKFKNSGHGQQLIRTALMTYSQSKNLPSCTPESFVRAVLKAAEYGLAIDGRLAYAVGPYNITYKDDKGREYKKPECQFQISYLGMIAVAKREGHIKNCRGEWVCDGDEFEHQLGSEPFIHHRFGPKRASSEITNAWIIITFPDGTEEHSVLTWGEALKAKECSRDKSIWNLWPGQQTLKTLIRSKMKRFSFDVKFDRLLQWDEPGNVTLDTGDTINAATGEIVTQPKTGTTPPVMDEEPDPVDARPEDLCKLVTDATTKEQRRKAKEAVDANFADLDAAGQAKVSEAIRLSNERIKAGTAKREPGQDG